jgi:hypothetical protein
MYHFFWPIRLDVLRLLACVAFILATSAFAQSQARLPDRKTFYLMPTVEGLYACQEAIDNDKFKDIDAVNSFCIQNQLDGSAGIRRVLDQLEPGGPKGQVQVGFMATLQLLSLYKRKGSQWSIDEKKLDAYLRVLSRIQRPIVVYLAADHFDSQGPLVDELIKDPVTFDPDIIVTPPPPPPATIVTSPMPPKGSVIPEPATILVTPPFPAVVAKLAVVALSA